MLGVWSVGALVFFRDVVGSGFDQIIGDQGDARLIVAIHEHWLNVLGGSASWRQPGYFYPTGEVLGYTDTFLINIPLYGTLRALGSDPWLALQLTSMAVGLIGFAATYLVLRWIVGANRLVACALAATFTFGNNMAVSGDHPQLVLVGWIPVVLLLAWGSLRSEARSRGVVLGAAAGALLGLLTYSAYYVGWFAVLASAVFVIVFTILRATSGQLSELIALVRSRTRSLVSFAAGAAIALVPFLLTYLPVLDDSTPRTYSDVMTFAPRPLDLINVGPDNHVWGSTMEQMMGDEPTRLQNTEVSLPVTPVYLGLVLVSGVLLVRHRRRGGAQLWTDAGIATVVTVAILSVLPIKWGIGSLWAVPWHLLPGAMGIRAAGRLQLVTSLLASVAVGAGVTLGLRSSPIGTTARRFSSVVALFVLAVVLVEQSNARDFARLDRSGERRAAALVPDPPASCRWFFMSPEQGRPPFVLGTDAMLIAVELGLPTLNGYSGTTPKGYSLDPSHEDYARRVEEWTDAHGLRSGMCAFDRRRGTWDVTPFDG